MSQNRNNSGVNAVANSTIAQEMGSTSFNLDFDKLFEREESNVESLPIEIQQNKVDALRKALTNRYDWANLSFHQNKAGILFIKLKYGIERQYQTIWSAADQELCNAVMHALRGKYNLIDGYKAEKHQSMCSKEKLILRIFRDFWESKLRVKIGKDYIPSKGKIFKKYSFHLSRTCQVKFCIEDTEELRSLTDKN